MSPGIARELGTVDLGWQDRGIQRTSEDLGGLLVPKQVGYRVWLPDLLKLHLKQKWTRIKRNKAPRRYWRNRKSDTKRHRHDNCKQTAVTDRLAADLQELLPDSKFKVVGRDGSETDLWRGTHWAPTRGDKPWMDSLVCTLTSSNSDPRRSSGSFSLRKIQDAKHLF